MSARIFSSPLGSWLVRLDQTLVTFMSAYGIHLLRWAIAIVYIWFGTLKLINASPAAELVVPSCAANVKLSLPFVLAAGV